MTVFGIYYVYCVTNLLNEKAYIGISNNPSRRWLCHQSIARTEKKQGSLHRAIAKYSVENFKFEVIACARTVADVKDMERMIIVQRGTLSPKGYNLCGGGEGGFGPSDETRLRMAQAKLGKKLTHEVRARMSAAAKGKPKSDAHKAQLMGKDYSSRVAKMLGKPRSPETRAKMSASNKGQTPSAASLIGRAASWPKGSKHTPESLAKIGAASRSRYAKAKVGGDMVV